MPRAKPTWRTRQLFDPGTHLTLDASGLRPNYMAINNSQASEDETARLLNYAQEFADSTPAICPRGFDATKHAQQQADGSWGPNVAGITGDNQLTGPQKIDVFRWGRIYRPNTTTDPACVKVTTQALGCFVGVMVVIAAITGTAIYLARRGSSSENCELQPLNANATEALLQSLREEFPQLVNATLENMNDWYPTIRSNLSELIYRDSAGNILERVCGSAARTLDPVLQLMVVFALLGLHMLLQA